MFLNEIPAVAAHIVDIAGRVPVQLAARLFGIGIAGRDIARTTRRDLIGNRVTARLFKRVDDFQNARALAGAQIDRLRAVMRVRVFQRRDMTQRQIDAINTGDGSLMFDLAERTISIDVESNVTYQVAIAGDWITQVPETRGLVTKTLRFHLDPATVSRSGKITISGAGITKVVSIVQKDPDAVVVSIPDNVFRSKLVSLNWLLELSGGLCVVTEDGLNATEFTYRPGYWDDPILSLEGIEIFANLEKIDVYNNKLSKFDISKLTKVSSLNIDYNGLSEIALGDNAVEELNFSALYHSGNSWDYIVPSSLTVSGTHLKTLKVPFSGGGGWWDPTDVLATIDVSGCPALETLNAQRNAGVLKTIYLKQGQVIPNLTYTAGAEIVYK